MEDGFAQGYAVGRDSNGSNGGYGMGAWGDWIWIIVLFALWQNGGFGFGGGNGGGIGSNYVLATDFATVERKLDAIGNGICDSTFALNNNITSGFAGVQQTLSQGFAGANTALVTNGYETRSAISDLGYRLQDCCCQTQRAIEGVNYNIATQFGGLNTTLCGLGRDIIENQNANYRALHEELVANKIEAKNERIAEQQAQITALQLKASQEAQNNYLINALKPCPVPAYITCNPYASVYGVGQQNGCGTCC